MRRLTFSLVLLWLLPFSVHAQAPGKANEKTVASILDAHREAVGASTSGATVIRRYRYAGQGLNGSTEVMFDRITGRFVERYDFAAIRGASTSRVALSLQHAGEVREVSLLLRDLVPPRAGKLR